MGSSDLIPEKFAMYFATMSPLASKIYADIEGIEDYVKSHGPPSMTYNEKCSIVDKFLIHDHLNRNDANKKLYKRLGEYQNQKFHMNKSEISLSSMEEKNGIISEAELLQPVFYNDAILDQDHETLLLTSVAPKKPEKYVYDDNNFWIDEHSATYSRCTHVQAKACNLQQLLNSLPPPTLTNKRSEHPHKYKAPPIPTLISKPSQNSYIITPTPKLEDRDRYSKIDKLDSEKSKGKFPVGVPLFGGCLEESSVPVPIKRATTSKSNEANFNDSEDLPKQVQNKDLIAELQAKLKKGKDSTDGISPRSSAKINKPRAPPPPPPGIIKPPGGPVKVITDAKTKPKSETSSKRISSDREITDDFVVDVSSPCKIATPKTGLDFLDNW